MRQASKSFSSTCNEMSLFIKNSFPSSAIRSLTLALQRHRHAQDGYLCHRYGLHLLLPIDGRPCSSLAANAHPASSSSQRLLAEHMEEDNADATFPHWIALEYAQMLKWASPNKVIFSSLSPASVKSLCQSSLPPYGFPLALLFETLDEVQCDVAGRADTIRRDRVTSRAAEQLIARGASPDAFRAETKSVTELMKEENVALDKVCLLDPRATGEIAPQDGKEFDWFL